MLSNYMKPNSHMLKSVSGNGVQAKRIIVVDPSLTDFVGHHAQYDISVIENAEELGMEGLVLCHRSVSDTIGKHVQVIRTFSEDMWGVLRVRRRVAFELKLGALAIISMLIVPSMIYTQAYRNAGRLKRWVARKRSHRERLNIRIQKRINNSLSKFIVHVLFGLVPNGIYIIGQNRKNFQKILGWADLLTPPILSDTKNIVLKLQKAIALKVKKAFTYILPPFVFKEVNVTDVVAFPVKALFKLITLVSPKIIILFFKGISDTAGISNFVGSLSQKLIFVVFGNHRYYLEAEEAFSAARLEVDDLVFFHMVIRRNILETAVLCEEIYSRTRVAPVVLLRYPTSFLASARPMLQRLALRKFEHLFETGKVRLASDSSRLIDEYSKVTYVPIELFPIPHGVEQHSTNGHVSERNEQLKIAVLGNARGEKGFIEICKMMRQLAEISAKLPVQFVIQANDPDSDALPYVREIRNAHFPFPVSVLTKSLDKQSYEALVASSDVILAPYWQEVYSSRTSGVALEAIIGAKILITTENTWMSDQVKLWRTGLTVKNRNVKSLTDAVLKAISKRDALTSRAKRGRKAAAKFHSGKSFIEHLVKRRLSRTESDKHVCFSYPWDNLFQYNSGASVRSSLVVRKIIEAGWRVTVLGQVSNSAVVPKGAAVVGLEEPRATLSNPVYFVDYSKRLLFSPRMMGLEDFQYRFRFWLRSRKAKLVINSILRHSSAVVIEYPFLASLFEPFAKAYGIPTVVNSHDVLGMQTGRKKLRRWIIEQEADALNSANFSSVISEDDRAIFENYGVRAHVIANAIDVMEVTVLSHREAHKRIAAAGVELALEQFGLFVGSVHPPNLVAAKRVAELSQDKLLLREGIGFVIAGACVSAQADVKYRNCLQLGRISDELLQALYSLASFVVIPLQSGTGSSVKTIEAFAYGKAVIGTEVAFRGFDVTNSHHCVISNQMDDYPRLIVELLRDPVKMKKIGNGAKDYANKRDYGVTFQPIVDAIERSEFGRSEYRLVPGLSELDFEVDNNSRTVA